MIFESLPHLQDPENYQRIDQLIVSLESFETASLYG
jgi:hypothetical protein